MNTKIDEQFSFDLKSMFGGLLGGMFKDTIKNVFSSMPSDLSPKEKHNIQDEILELQKRYLAQLILTGEVSSKTKGEMKELEIWDVTEREDFKGFIRIAKTKIRRAIDRQNLGKINIETLIF